MERATVTVEEAGEILGISRGSAYQAAREGRLPAIRVGRRLVVPKVQLERMLDGVDAYVPLGRERPLT